MINDASLQAVAAAHMNQHFVRPRYDEFGFAALPQTLRRLLLHDTHEGVSFGPRHDLYDHYDTVILFFVDAFGWRFFEQSASMRHWKDRVLTSSECSPRTQSRTIG